MTGPLLIAALVAAQGAPPSASLCVPVVSDRPRPVPSAIEAHRALRLALGEPMPTASTLVTLYGRGGHLATDEYSIVLARTADGRWRGTAIGRSRIWVQGAPYQPMKRADWTLDRLAGRRLDAAIARRCRDQPAPSTPPPGPPPPPPRGLIAERIDVVRPGSTPLTFYEGDNGSEIAALLRPPK